MWHCLARRPIITLFYSLLPFTTGCLG